MDFIIFDLHPATCGQERETVRDAMEIRDRVVVVTGAGSGIGRELARAFAREGGRVACAGRRLGALEETVLLVKAERGDAMAVAVDVSDPSEVGAAMAHVEKTWGRVDVLVNNAGVMDAPAGPTWETSVDDWWQVLAVNLRGTMLCCRAVLPGMVVRGEGVVLNMSGGGAESPLPGASAYGVSKAAILRLTDTLAAELRIAGSPVVVCALDPGFNRTAMTEGLAHNTGIDRWMPHVHRTLDSGRHNQPSDCAATAVALVRCARPEFSGRVFHAKADIGAMEHEAAEIARVDRYTLRLKP